MKRLTLIAIAGCSLLATQAFAQRERAVPRGSGGGASSDVGARHHSPSASSPSPNQAAPPAASPGLTSAERRHPRAGTGTGSRGGSRGGRPGGYYPGYGGGYYSGYGGYYPVYGAGWYYPSSSWGYWWPYGAYGWPGYWGSPWGAGAVYTYVQTDRGSIRVLVDPPDARVYVDGYYAGVVDDFDGLFQRLHVAPGRHEIEVKLAGHKTYRVRVYVGSGSTLKLDHDLEPGTGEDFEDLAGDAPRREVRGERPEESWDAPKGAEPPALAGDLALRIEPDDASVYIDGAFWGTGRDTSSVSLPPGTHQVEVVRPGFRTEEREVEVRPHDLTKVTIELRRP